MLRKNPLQPPRPFTAPDAAAGAFPAAAVGFLAADDFDATGIMAGVDPSESRYWWLAELYGPEDAPQNGPHETVVATVVANLPAAQATSRAGSRAAAAA